MQSATPARRPGFFVPVIGGGVVVAGKKKAPIRILIFPVPQNHRSGASAIRFAASIQHAGNDAFIYGTRLMKKTLFSLAIASIFAPVVALAATPVIGLGYSDVGLSGHAGRPGITLSAGQVSRNNVDASGSVTFARSFYHVNADIGKIVPLSSSFALVPHLGAGFISLNSQQSMTWYSTTTQNLGYGATYTYASPYQYTVPSSIQDFYVQAGANLEYRITPRLRLAIGGGFGHTVMVLNGNGGQVYDGHATLNIGLARRWTGDATVGYLHLPGAAITQYGAGVSYHFS
ncbi:hypothetical protein JKG47_04800 [Acidithiobacillus sp. MC6.1]|nr:hypothetical protein [Acidithiobacillus sp. MC6.1]